MQTRPTMATTSARNHASSITSLLVVHLIINPLIDYIQWDLGWWWGYDPNLPIQPIKFQGAKKCCGHSYRRGARLKDALKTTCRVPVYNLVQERFMDLDHGSGWLMTTMAMTVITMITSVCDELWNAYKSMSKSLSLCVCFVVSQHCVRSSSALASCYELLECWNVSLPTKNRSGATFQTNHFMCMFPSTFAWLIVDIVAQSSTYQLDAIANSIVSRTHVILVQKHVPRGW